MARFAFSLALLAALVLSIPGCGSAESKTEPNRGKVSYNRFPQRHIADQKKPPSP
jgi:hypothetical protein